MIIYKKYDKNGIVIDATTIASVRQSRIKNAKQPRTNWPIGKKYWKMNPANVLFSEPTSSIPLKKKIKHNNQNYYD